ncbi:M3 family oligoendopeptidase [Aliivibrio sp. S4TY2]|uniref:M3 family oligoendopeptidase n=1 Tax=unclassified Aliivibrio TaxID=2645654 RepID=UPI002379D2A6|nr:MULTISPECIES: M3 family oligoendopeptidase [unclassified Aliivibrio]MDD9157044.1 M3 family oligoendopeptidase [Aliivibrio sp. S4TY2]MDD9160742.1 M3 family oligoendopeptidase [Aliivibrio sp. S4TY1]MDD9164771.1 M3 family oligoendopeptidase [Aliivibrio sp. S4MY2]MDD9168954.1 M3 family oligoendopeptidase [Aliivibrio sp. S4MY4]MDD9185482.1 M3 family oligoendopeptidase [Aliivibrio sp. S4MY3]
MTAPSWDLSIAFQSLDDPKLVNTITSIEERILHFAADDINVNVDGLQQAIIEKESISVQLATVGSYGNCIASVDGSNSQAKALVNQVTKLASDLSQAFSPYLDAIVNAPTECFEQVLSLNDELEAQRFLLEEERKLVATRLSVKEEQLLSAMSVDGKNAWGRLYDNITGSMKVTLQLPNGTEETIGLSQAASILYGSDTLRREPAWHAIQLAMKQHQESFSAILNALAGWRLTEYQKRSAANKLHFLEPSLHGSRIEQQTLDSMISVAKKNRAVGQKAGRLMAKMFGTEQLTPWDQQASMPPLVGEASNYSFDEAIEIIKDAFSGVSQEMADFVDLMVKNGRIDAAPQETKRLGAYCTKFADTRTPLVFMTWGNSMSDVLTLAHELGHAFHNWVMRDMPLCKTKYPMTLAETASIFAENVVRDALLAKAKTKEDKIEMLWEELSSALALTINIPVRYEFEKAFYEQRATKELGPTQLSDLMSQTWSEWYGEAMSEPDPMFWASKLHFSIPEVSFYNYPYLFGYLFSIGVYAQREAKGERFYSDYVSLLRDTGSMRAEEVVKKHLQMDLTKEDFWQQSLDRVSQQIDEFERLVS